MNRCPCALLVHFRQGDDEGTVLAAIGDLLIDQLDDWGWTTDWTHPFRAQPRVGLWVFEGVAIPDDEDLDFQGKWRRPTPEELGRLTEGAPVWEDERRRSGLRGSSATSSPARTRRLLAEVPVADCEHQSPDLCVSWDYPMITVDAEYQIAGWCRECGALRVFASDNLDEERWLLPRKGASRG